MDEQNKNNAGQQAEQEKEQNANGAGANNNEGSGGTEQSQQQQRKQQTKEKTFTQEQVNQMMTREKNQGRAAALRDLGIDPQDTKTITLLQSILKGNGADGGQQGQEGAANQQAVAEAERRAIVAEAKAEAMKMHAKAEFVDDVVTLALSKMGDDKNGDLVTVIGEVKAKYAGMFEGEAKDDESDAGQKGTGSSVKGKAAKNSKNDEGNNLGARLAAQRKSRNAGKKSFWG